MGAMVYHLIGAEQFVLYDMTKPLVKDLMNDWYDLTVKQYSGEWWPSAPDGTPDTVNYPKSLARWDQFSLWWLLNREPKYSDILVGRLDGRIRLQME